MRIFQNRTFEHFAHREGIDTTALCEAVQRAEAGSVDAVLGGGVIKQRIARPGSGKSGGFRSIILYRAGELAFFVYGFAKNQLDNISDKQLKALKKLAKISLGKSEAALELDLQAGELIEVICNEGD